VPGLALGLGLGLATRTTGGGVFALFINSEPLYVDGEPLWVGF